MELKLEDLEQILQVPESTILKWIKEKEFPTYKINNQYSFNHTQVYHWLLDNKIHLTAQILELSLTHKPVIMNDLLQRGGIVYQVRGNNPGEVIQDALSRMPIPNEISQEEILYLLLERESMMSTAIGKGIAIPHPRNPIIIDIEHESLTICFLKNAIEYHAIDGYPVQILFIILSANASRHLEILAKLSYLLQQEDFTQLLHRRAEADEIYSFIRLKDLSWLTKVI